MYDPLPPSPTKFRESNKLVPIFFVLTLIAFLSTTYVSLHLAPLGDIALNSGSDSESTGNTGSSNFSKHKQTEFIWKSSVFVISTSLLLYCYVLAILTDPGSVPDTESWRHCITNRGDEISSFTFERKRDGDLRACKWCAKFKPDRAHHCRVMGRCILKMDHHCPWIYNTVGFYNYKYFFLILFYTCIDLWLISITMWPTVHDLLDDSSNSFGIMFAGLFCETLAAFLALVVTTFFMFHCYLLSLNMTTIEYCEKRGGGGSENGPGEEKKSLVNSSDGSSSNFDNGSIYRNICASLGSNPLFWLFPLTGPEGNGLYYKWKGQDTSSVNHLNVQVPNMVWQSDGINQGPTPTKSNGNYNTNSLIVKGTVIQGPGGGNNLESDDNKLYPTPSPDKLDKRNSPDKIVGHLPLDK